MTPQPQQQPQTQGFQKAAMSAVAAVLLAGSIVSVEPAFAAMDDSIMNMDSSFGGSSQLVAARSGGRAGGRSSAAMRAPSRPSSAASSMSNTRVIQRTTYISPSPVIVAPPMYGYGYNPVPGLGLSLGLNAINQIGNDVRDYRQETEIRDTRAQLQSSQVREAELEARLRALEQANQNNQLNAQQQQQLMQIEMMMKQMQATPAAAPAK